MVKLTLPSHAWVHFIYIFWGQISWVIILYMEGPKQCFILQRAQGLSIWSLRSKPEKRSYGFWCPIHCCELLSEYMNRPRWGPDLCVELDPNILPWQCDLTSVESPTLHESFRNFTGACFPPKKGVHIHWETPPFRDLKSKTLLQAQSTKMLDSNCSRESQYIYFTVEAQARWNCTPLRQVSYKL